MRTTSLVFSGRRRVRRSPDQILGLLDELDASDLSQREFCVEHGVPLSTLTFWRRRYGRSVSRGRRQDSTVSAPFIPISVVSDAPQARVGHGHAVGPFVVELSSGCRVQVPSDFEPAVLRSLLATLGAAC